MRSELCSRWLVCGGKMEIADEWRRNCELYDFDVQSEQGMGELHNHMPVILAVWFGRTRVLLAYRLG